LGEQEYPQDTSPHPPDIVARAQGQAALMLLDSLTMVLVEQKLVHVERIVEAIELTITTKRGMLDSGEDAETVNAAIGMLSAMANSISAAQR